MCGFVGFLTNSAEGAGGLDDLVGRMAHAISHRGPDGAGTWSDKQHGIALAHRRLAVVDLSPAGYQPMVSSSGRYLIVFNGEIYNHEDLRRELASSNLAPAWRGHSDTETLLASIAAWGVQATVARCIGMFAFALWDRTERTLTLGRDRVGEKPLYYGWQGHGTARTFIFGSELKALKLHPAFERKVSRDALCLQMRFNYVPAPHSIYQGISKLEPGCIATVSASRPEPAIIRYWSIPAIAAAGTAAPFTGSASDAVEALEARLKAAVKRQMVADVPLGAFLSGGVDSTTVVSLMQIQSSQPVRTFTIGFEDERYNEAEHAKRVARHLGTDHWELYVSARDALNVIPRLPTLYCEPFSDSSQIPTFLVSQLARQHVTVALSGDGGDEIFGGYNRYVLADRLWNRLSKFPAAGRRLAGRGLTAVSDSAWNNIFAVANRILPASLRQAHAGAKMHKAGHVIGAHDMQALYLNLVRNWKNPADVVCGATEVGILLDERHEISGLDDIQRMMALDMMTYLPDDILAKVDRAGMGVSLEGRMPFLDHEVVEFAWTLPQRFKIMNGQGKWILREVLYRHVPKELIERPKMGFGIPIGDWLRGPLREWAEELLDERRLMREGFFDPITIRRKWTEHLSRSRNWEHQLWAVLMFQAWLENE
jgi:asparagine synthase (glutamine-hydrolysing)